jgi:hypothetical protein
MLNVNKTKEMRINSDIEHSLSINGKDMEQVESFLYLGSLVTKGGGAKEDVKNRIRKANVAFVQLYPVWKDRNISRKSKLRLFNSNVKSVLLYGCETWKVTKQITNQLLIFSNRCLRCIINRRWRDMISNENSWVVINQQPIGNQIKERKLRWIGHTLRKTEGAIERAALDWNPQGARRRGRPRKIGRRRLKKKLQRWETPGRK